MTGVTIGKSIKMKNVIVREMERRASSLYKEGH